MAGAIIPKFTAAQNNARTTQNWDDGQTECIVLAIFPDPDT
jgi:hypothetical protein